MDDRGWYKRNYEAINTPIETIKRLKEEEREIEASGGNLLMLMWGNVALFAKFIKIKVRITLWPAPMQHISSPGGKVYY